MWGKIHLLKKIIFYKSSKKSLNIKDKCEKSVDLSFYKIRWKRKPPHPTFSRITKQM